MRKRERRPVLVNLKDLLRRVEADAIREVLARNEGNQTSTAEELGLNRTTMIMRMKALKKMGYL